MPYPLPTGELGDDDIVCQLVYLPDRPEYWQAFLGALSYMSTWRAWERDEDKRGKDAAANWREANELTMECWRMTCLEQLQDDVAAILAIMQIPQACCDPGDVTDGDQYTDRVTDGVGDVPQNIIDAGYATGVGDWAGFDDYKCMIAHVIVSQLEERLNEIAPLIDTAGGILGGVAALAGILAVIFGTGGLAIVFGIVAGIGATSLLYQAIADFGLVGTLVDKVATNHDELACATYDSDGDVGALIALNDKIDELFTVPEALILKNMNMGPTLKSLYAGRYDQQDIADILNDAGYDVSAFDCTCIEYEGDYQKTTTWPNSSDWQGWTSSGTLTTDGNPAYGVRLRYGGPVEVVSIDMSALAAHAGVSNPSNRRYLIHSVRWDRKADSALPGTLLIMHRTTEGTSWIQEGFSNVVVWTETEKDWGPTGREIQYTGDIRFAPTGGTGNYWHVDNVVIDFSTYLV